MRCALGALLVFVLGGCTSSTHWALLHREQGRTVADVTLVAGEPDMLADLPDGRRIYQWRRSHLVPRGGPVCVYTLYAEREGRPQSLAAWRVTGIEVPEPGCEPLERA